MKFKFDFNKRYDVEEFREKKEDLYNIVSDMKSFKKPKQLAEVLQNFLVDCFINRLNKGYDNVADQFTRYSQLEDDLVDFLKGDNIAFNPLIKSVDIDSLKLLQTKTDKNGVETTEFNENFTKALSKMPSNKFKSLITIYYNDINPNSNQYRYNNEKNKFVIKELKKAQEKRGLFRKIADFFTGRKKEEDSIIKLMEDQIKDEEEKIKVDGVIRFKDEENDLEFSNKIEKEFRPELINVNPISKKEEKVYNKGFNLDGGTLFDTNLMGAAAKDLLDGRRIIFHCNINRNEDLYNKMVKDLGSAFVKYTNELASVEYGEQSGEKINMYKEFLTKCCQALSIDDRQIKALLKGVDHPSEYLGRHGDFKKWCKDLDEVSPYIEELEEQKYSSYKI